MIKKNTKRIYLSPPNMSGNEIDYIKQAFNENWIAPLGPNVDAFEKLLANYCDVKYAAALSSGTAALHLALIIHDVRKGDEVIASTFTFSATINPIVYQGAKPILIDSEAETWNMDPDLLEQAIRKSIKRGTKPKAIIIVHLYGMPSKMTEISKIAAQYDIPIIEDAAEALGSKLEGKSIGSFGNTAILSFNGNKIITTSGGGALISNDEEVVKKAKFLGTQARDKAVHYQHSSIGYNYRMSNILAGIGIGQMEVIDKYVSAKRKIFDFYKENLRTIPGITFQEEPEEKYFSNRWLTAILIDRKKNGIEIERIIKEMEKNNIETRPLWKPMHLQPIFSGVPAFLNGNSSYFFNNGICLPSGSGMTEEELVKVVTVFKSLYSDSSNVVKTAKKAT